MKEAIAGAGIGGLAAACLLTQDGQAVTLCDQFEAPRPLAGAARRVTCYGLLVDAAHRKTPQLGKGANMALFDALALARASKIVSAEEALPRNANIRRWHVGAY